MENSPAAPAPGHLEDPERSTADTSEKAELERLEEESIASALEGERNDGLNDIEKASTKADQSINEPAQRVKTAADWDGPDDTGNPQTWPILLRAYHTTAIGMLSFAVTAGSSLISPATPDMAAHFQVSRTVAILPLTLYVLGLGFGPVLAAPISETFGRNVVYRATSPIFILFLAGSGLIKSFGSLLVCRLLAGLVGGPVLAVGAGSSAVSSTRSVPCK